VLALAALTLSLGTAIAFGALLLVLLIPLRPVAYLSALGLAVVLAVGAVVADRRGGGPSRRGLTFTALAVSVALMSFASAFNFVLMRVPPDPSAFVVGQPAPSFTLPDARGQRVSLADFRGRKPVVLVFYRGYW
jgi:hypothetical protein